MAKIYTCSSVKADYFTFLKECLKGLPYDIVEIYYLSEAQYRREARRRGITRIAFRIKLYLAYPVRLLWRAATAERSSVFIVTSNTFYAPLLVSLIARMRGCKTIHLLYDLFPDALVVAGKLNANSLKARLLGRITRSTQSKCAGTVYLGRFLQRHAEAKWGQPKRSSVIHISADSRRFAETLRPVTKPIVFHYGGQIGHMHDAETTIAAIRGVWSDPGLAKETSFKFLVSGAQSEFVRRSFEGTAVDVSAAVQSDMWRETIRDYHVGIVTLKPGGATVCLPSKSYAMMAGGLAIVAICPPWSDLGRLVIDNEVGWVVSNSPYAAEPNPQEIEYARKVSSERPPPEVASDFEACVRLILANPEELERRRRNAYRLMRGTYSLEHLAQQWEDFLKAC